MQSPSEAESGEQKPLRRSGTLTRSVFGWVLAGLVAVGVYQTVRPQSPGLVAPPEASRLQPVSSAHPPTAQFRGVLDRYCVTCHNEKSRTAGLVLSTLDVEKVSEEAAIWEKVVKKLRARSMPPEGMPRPDEITYDAFAMYLETTLDLAAVTRPNPGKPAVHRLNRAEYTNAVRDVLAIDINGGAFLPADDSRHGFDNIGNVLTVSPLLLESYLSAARKISRLAIGDPESPNIFETYNAPKYFVQDDRMSDEFPFGSRGGIAVRHHFPADGEYLVKIQLARNSRDYIRGLGDSHQIDIRLDGVRVKLLTIGGEGKDKGKSSPIFSNAGLGDPAQEIYERTADHILEARFQAKAGPRLVNVAFINDQVAPEGPLRQLMTQYDFMNYKGGDPAVASISVGGPSEAKGIEETPSRRRIFECRPTAGADEELCAKKILSTLARRAYRRTPTEEEIQTLLGFYKTGRSEEGFEAGIRTALERILVGPEFLFRIEPDPENVAPGTAYRLSDLELASRLSFFLWSSIPDDTLLDLAERGKLKESEVLEQQVRRLLADPRSKALVTNFAGQWLFLRSLREVNPDLVAFPYFDDNLRDAFRQEMELLFESFLREDRSVLNLLNAEYTFLNERLARHYGIPNIYGSHFRRVALKNEERRGLLGKGAILTVTSYANRTSPVQRGKWVLENVLGAPPPPPPPNVPALRERNQDGKILSMRQAMEQHRSNPACASCHKVMDPLGFALENFDGIGTWRTTDADTPIDASGVLPDGTRFEGPGGLQKMLLSASKRDQFVATATERLLTYALGRGIEYYDAPAIRKILREAAPGDYRWSSLILGIVKSTPFRMRRSGEP